MTGYREGELNTAACSKRFQATAKFACRAIVSIMARAGLSPPGVSRLCEAA